MNIRLRKRCESVNRFEGNLFLDLRQLEIQIYMLKKKESVSSVENMQHILIVGKLPLFEKGNGKVPVFG